MLKGGGEGLILMGLQVKHVGERRGYEGTRCARVFSGFHDAMPKMGRLGSGCSGSNSPEAGRAGICSEIGAWSAAG